MDAQRPPFLFGSVELLDDVPELVELLGVVVAGPPLGVVADGVVLGVLLGLELVLALGAALEVSLLGVVAVSVFERVERLQPDMPRPSVAATRAAAQLSFSFFVVFIIFLPRFPARDMRRDALRSRPEKARP